MKKVHKHKWERIFESRFFRCELCGKVKENEQGFVYTRFRC
jgi:hypothetical protein